MNVPDTRLRSLLSGCSSTGRVALFAMALGAVLAPASAAHAADEATTAVERLILASRVYDERVMTAAANALAAIGAPAVPSLTEALEDFDDNVRWQSIVALGKIGRPALVTVPALLQSLDDVDPDVRAAAAETLGLLGAKHKPVLNRLKQSTADEHSLVRASAAWSLWKISGRRESILELAELLHHRDWMVAARAERHLASIGRPAVPELKKRLQQVKNPARDRMAQALGCIGAPSESAVIVLVNCLEDSDTKLSNAAAKALGQIGKPAVREVTRFLMSKPTLGRVNAVRALGMIGPDARDALPVLLAELDAPQPDPAMTLSSIRAIGRIGNGRSDCADGVSPFLRSQDADTRGAACAALGDIGIATGTVTLHLNQIAEDDPQDYVRQAASSALAALRNGPEITSRNCEP